MRFRIGRRCMRPRRKGLPPGSPPSFPTSKRGGLEAQTRRGDRGGEAEEQHERGGDTVENPFEVCERHDTHLSVGTSWGEEAFSYLNSAQIGKRSAAVKASLRRLDMKLW